MKKHAYEILVLSLTVSVSISYTILQYYYSPIKGLGIPYNMYYIFTSLAVSVSVSHTIVTELSQNCHTMLLCQWEQIYVTYFFLL